MSNDTKKYASLESLKIFKDNADNLYATQEYIDAVASTKANASHAHEISDVTNLKSSLDGIGDILSQKSQVQVITSDIAEVLSTLKIHKLTQEEYDQIVSNDALEDNAIYLTPDEEIDLSNYVTVGQLSGKADATHSHDDIYYTEVEMNALLLNKADVNHDHNGVYDVKGAADEALVSAKSYADNAANNAANSVKNDLLNGAGEAYDTLKELGDLINENTDAIDALETVASRKADVNHVHNDIYNTKTEIDDKISTINTSLAAYLSEAKSYSDTNLNTSKSYTDNAVAQKSQIQIIMWEADD